MPPLTIFHHKHSRNTGVLAPAGRILLLFFLLSHTPEATAQKQNLPPLISLVPADTLHPGRVRIATLTAAVAYPVSISGLWKSWYSDYPIGKFHFFNDNGEWNQMDKAGHFFSTYQEARVGWHLARWSGFSNRKAAWLGFGLGQLVQTSFEVMDGFSTQWGFSLGDVAMNTLGASLFTTQQIAWNEQRITLKMSTFPPHYPDDLVYPVRGQAPPVSLRERARELYGTGLGSLLAKDYNAQVIWMSVNPRSFQKHEGGSIPRWLNVAVGMGSDNMYAGYGYAWLADKKCGGPDCVLYAVDPAKYPRTRQYFLSLDIDLTRIPVKNRVLRNVLLAVNTLKIPAPTLEFTSRGAFRFHPLYF